VGLKEVSVKKKRCPFCSLSDSGFAEHYFLKISPQQAVLTTLSFLNTLLWLFKGCNSVLSFLSLSHSQILALATVCHKTCRCLILFFGIKF